MIFSTGAYWTIFAGFVISTYSLSAIILILLYFTRKKCRNEIVNWLYIFNTVVAWVCLINFVYYAGELFIAWYGQNPYEWYVFKENKASLFSPYGWSYWLMLTGGSLLPFLLFFRKLRKSLVFTFLTAFFLNAGALYERFVIFITSLYRDYLPSSWSTYNSDVPVSWLRISILWICLVTVLLFTYWFANKRKKLPFKSAILSYSLFLISYPLLPCSQNFN